jgi:hypothetical protein
MALPSSLSLDPPKYTALLNLFLILEEITMTGRRMKAQVVIGQQMTKPKTDPIKMARTASVIAAAGSAVTPLIFLASD